jgi:hypothetical protein
MAIAQASVTLGLLHMGILRVTRVTSFLERVAWFIPGGFLKKPHCGAMIVVIT